MGGEEPKSSQSKQFIMEFKMANDGTWFDQHRIKELIYCKDCKYRYKEKDCPVVWHKREEDFCSWGERMEGE